MFNELFLPPLKRTNEILYFILKTSCHMFGIYLPNYLNVFNLCGCIRPETGFFVLKRVEVFRGEGLRGSHG